MPTLQETHYAVVTNTNDPQQQGRIKVRCQSLVGANVELPYWIPPMAGLLDSNGLASALFLPQVGSTVNLICDMHDSDFDDMPGERFLQNPNMKWTPAGATNSSGPMPLAPALLEDYPNTSGFVTSQGHTVTMNDKSGVMTIKGAKGGVITLNADGSITISSPALLGAGATELMVLGNAFMTLYNAHTHPTGVGPSGPPTVAMGSTQLSQNGNKVT